MAGDDRTEKPTAKRRGEARKKGQVAKSSDLGGAMVLIGGLVAVLLMAGKIVDTAASVMVNVFGQISHPGSVATQAGLEGLVHLGASAVLSTVVPIFGICIVVAIVVNVAQTGLREDHRHRQRTGRAFDRTGFHRRTDSARATDAARHCSQSAVYRPR